MVRSCWIVVVNRLTCSITGVLAGWTISGLSEVSVTDNSEQSAADNNAMQDHLYNTHSGDPSSSTIAVTGLTTT